MVPVVYCSEDGDVSFAAAFFPTAFLMGGLVLTVFLGAIAAAFFTATFVAAGAAFLLAVETALAGLANRQRFLVAAMILFIPAALIRRFAFGAFVVAGSDGSDGPRILAHRFRCASATALLPAALILRRLRFGASGVVAVSAGPPDNIARSSASCWFMRFFCPS
ncbi:MAG: hypothetical protein ABSE42_11355 [Bryobacteraceae bacterium]|jgi:hypothetical protein